MIKNIRTLNLWNEQKTYGMYGLSINNIGGRIKNL